MGIPVSVENGLQRQAGYWTIIPLSRPASCSRELWYGPCLVSGMGHETEFMIKGVSSTCWLAHQSLWPMDYWRQCQSQVGAQVRDGRIQCVQHRGFGVRMEMD